jgi:hypothetical protein
MEQQGLKKMHRILELFHDQFFAQTSLYTKIIRGHKIKYSQHINISFLNNAKKYNIHFRVKFATDNQCNCECIVYCGSDLIMSFRNLYVGVGREEEAVEQLLRNLSTCIHYNEEALAELRKLESTSNNM